MVCDLYLNKAVPFFKTYCSKSDKKNYKGTKLFHILKVICGGSTYN